MIWTHNLSVTRHAVYRCATTAAQKSYPRINENYFKNSAHQATPLEVLKGELVLLP